jgi:hypothetical protein
MLRVERWIDVVAVSVLGWVGGLLTWLGVKFDAFGTLFDAAVSCR